MKKYDLTTAVNSKKITKTVLFEKIFKQATGRTFNWSQPCYHIADKDRTLVVNSEKWNGQGYSEVMDVTYFIQGMVADDARLTYSDTDYLASMMTLILSFLCGAEYKNGLPTINPKMAEAVIVTIWKAYGNASALDAMASVFKTMDPDGQFKTWCEVNDARGWDVALQNALMELLDYANTCKGFDKAFEKYLQDRVDRVISKSKNS